VGNEGRNRADAYVSPPRAQKKEKRAGQPSKCRRRDGGEKKEGPTVDVRRFGPEEKKRGSELPQGQNENRARRKKKGGGKISRAFLPNLGVREKKEGGDGEPAVRTQGGPMGPGGEGRGREVALTPK